MVFGLFGGRKRREARLIEASRQGDVLTIRELLDKGVDINAVEPESGDTPIIAAIDKNQWAAAELILSRGPDLKHRDDNGFSALYLAASRGEDAVSVIRGLLKAGAPRELGPTQGKQAGGTPVHAACATGSNGALQVLLEHGASPSLALPDGATPLHTAALGGDAETVRLLCEAGAKVDALTHARRTPLHHCATVGNAEVAAALIERQAAIDPSDAQGYTPLMRAIQAEEKEVCLILLEAGVDPNGVVRTNDAVLTPLFVAASHGADSVIPMLLERGADIGLKVEGLPSVTEWAKKQGHAEAAKLLATARRKRNEAAKKEKTSDSLRADLVAALDGRDGNAIRRVMEDSQFKLLESPLRLLACCALGDEKAVTALLDSGVSPDAVSPGVIDGATPVLASIMGGHEDVSKLLLDRGADPNLAGDDGLFPLMHACARNNVAIAGQLIEHGASVDAETSGGTTALIVAAAAGHRDAVDLLHRAGVDLDATLTDGEPYFSHPKGEWGIGAFGIAIDSKHMDLALHLLECGATPEFGELKVDLCLTLAKFGTIELIEALEARGVSIVMDHPLLMFGAPPIEMHLRNMQSKIAFWAAFNPDEAVLDHVLQKGADPLKGNDLHMTPLILAAVANRPKVVDRLLNDGADPEAIDCDGETALSLAFERAHKAVVAALRKRGAQSSAYPGLSPKELLLAASREGRLGTVIDALEQGASPNARDAAGNTALMLAAQAGRVDVVRALYAMGALLGLSNEAGQTAWDLAQPPGHSNVLASLAELAQREPRLSEKWPQSRLVAYTGRQSHPFKDEPVFG